MLVYMLDTNAISDGMRHPSGRVAARIREVGLSAVCVSVIVAAELRFGAARSPSKMAAHRVDDALFGIEVLPFEPPADDIYGRIRADLQARGKTIGGNDLFIAAHALAMNLTLVTANEREFRRVEGLRVENWLSG
ncbi:VapC toxin protein [Caenispirillum salinarum AK4]|uniref:Ribonuclease VapC n=1 Tax=Caenispirillum salinarum AK4 TaxID=1238182 RepID=K9HF57_9PROT|nr:type II toxin-antitoxin system VapC family toxin [Caenispirillum salinarum]EKV27311.1 VapC toxin protein [Caenispirillum salinarum AK4]